jgi:hypothetical protein
VPVDEVIDRADRRERVHGEHNPAEGGFPQEFPAFAQSEFQGLPWLDPRWRLTVTRHLPSCLPVLEPGRQSCRCGRKVARDQGPPAGRPACRAAYPWEVSRRSSRTRPMRCAYHGVIWRTSWWRRFPGVAGLRECGGWPEVCTAAYQLGDGRDHASEGRGGPGWGRCPAWWTVCIGSCQRERCTFRLARFRLSVTSVFAGPHSA